MTARALIWFRRDLRLDDNLALVEAARDYDELVGVFVLSPRMWRAHDEAPRKVQLWLDAAEGLGAALEARGVALKVLRADTPGEVAAALRELCKALDCKAIYFNNEYEINEQRRDLKVAEMAADEGLHLRRFDTRYLTLPGSLKTAAGGPYTVFTPFRRRWAEALSAVEHRPLSAPTPRQRSALARDPVPTQLEGFEGGFDRALWPATEAEAERRLKRFVSHGLAAYAEGRDRPAEAGTSALSPYLAAGLLSPRRALAAALKANNGRLSGGLPGSLAGPSTWLSELAWRDFYGHVLVNFPRVSRHRAFKVETERLAWREAPDELSRWCAGQTGFALVDAGMRQLMATGWMHNRVRMVVASFLSKDLMLDWRLGERHFMQHLIDGDLAANNGGWQWAASTGTDAQPWFRIFNPDAQAEKFDPEARYIGRWVPELKGLSLKQIARLTPAERRARGYAQPMVDRGASRARVMAAFRALGLGDEAPRDAGADPNA